MLCFIIQVIGCVDDFDLVFKPWLEYWTKSLLVTPGPQKGIISGHLNSEQVKVGYSHVSLNQMFFIQIPTVFPK